MTDEAFAYRHCLDMRANYDCVNRVELEPSQSLATLHRERVFVMTEIDRADLATKGCAGEKNLRPVKLGKRALSRKRLSGRIGRDP